VFMAIKSTPWSLHLIIRETALEPEPPTPITLILANDSFCLFFGIPRRKLNIFRGYYVLTFEDYIIHGLVDNPGFWVENILTIFIIHENPFDFLRGILNPS